MMTKQDAHDDLIGKQRMIVDQREANEHMVRTVILAQEQTEQAVAARARAEAMTNALRENEERYRTLFDLSPAAVYSCDTSGVIQQFNRHAAELWGREPALGDTDEKFCGSFKLFRPDGRFMPHEQCPMAEVLSGNDNEDAADMLAEMLTSKGCHTRVAHDGPAALRLCEDFTPTVALLDIGLPVMDGYELAGRLRALDRIGHLRLVAVTGYGGEADRQRSRAAGFETHLVKPIDLDALDRVLAGQGTDHPKPA